MLKSLYIKNFALIDELKVTFDRGLNIITGETGSGKSILIGAIDIVFGARASKEIIKTGEERALIELELSLGKNFPMEILSENGLDVDIDGVVVLSREITSSSTRSRLNGVIVTQNFINDIKEYLIDIHSQHQTYTYIQPKTHVNLLDNYGNEEHKALLSSFKNLFSELLDTKKAYKEAFEKAQSFHQHLDFLKFQVEEIENANIIGPDEYDELEKERNVLLNAEELKKTTLVAYNALYGQDSSIVDVLRSLEKDISKVGEFDKSLSSVAELLIESSENLKDTADELRNYSESLEYDEKRMAEIDDRIEILEKIKRKYGKNLEEVLQNYEKLKGELNQAEFGMERVFDLEKKQSELENMTSNFATQLSESRQELAKALSSLIEEELHKLEMPNAKFEIAVNPSEILNVNGFDNVEFMISPNAGEPIKPLAKIASGGEVSRVMLAIKTVFAQADSVNTVIFDEIDTGISGRTSQAVAESMARLAKTHQILCITHQPIIASMADKHLYIEKIQDLLSTKVVVSALKEDEKVKALASMASGRIDSDSHAFAQNLLKQAQGIKSSI